jgi:hypothetical protein
MQAAALIDVNTLDVAKIEKNIFHDFMCIILF